MNNRSKRKPLVVRVVGNSYVALWLGIAAVLAWSFICAATSTTGVRIASVGLLAVILAILTLWVLNNEGEDQT